MIYVFSVEEFSAQEAWYLGEKLYCLDNKKISAKGLPSYEHNIQLLDKLLSEHQFSINTIRPDQFFNIVGDNITKKFTKNIIPLKRFFITKYYSIAHE